MARSSRAARTSCAASSDMPTGTPPATWSRPAGLTFLAGKGPLTGTARTSIMLLPASGAMRSVAAMRPARRCRTTNRDRLSGLRLTSTRATSATTSRSRECGNQPAGRGSAGRSDIPDLLLLLYGAGLRFSEATGLTLAYVDLADAVLTIRATKFYKSVWRRSGPSLPQPWMPICLCDKATLSRQGFLLSGEPGWNAARQQHRSCGVRRPAADRRNPRCGRRPSGSAPA